MAPSGKVRQVLRACAARRASNWRAHQVITERRTDTVQPSEASQPCHRDGVWGPCPQEYRHGAAERSEPAVSPGRGLGAVPPGIPTRCSRAKRASRVTGTGFGGRAPKQIGAPGRAQPPTTPQVLLHSIKCRGGEHVQAATGARPTRCSRAKRASRVTGTGFGGRAPKKEGPPVSRSEPGHPAPTSQASPHVHLRRPQAEQLVHSPIDPRERR